MSNRGPGSMSRTPNRLVHLHHLCLLGEKYREKVVGSRPKIVFHKLSVEEALIQAYLHVSICSIVRKNQKGTEYYEHIHQYFCEEINNKYNRTKDNLKSHWHYIITPTNYFCGIYKRYTKSHDSYFDDLVMNQAKEE
ncbi:hypothetical protein HanRHA438_Chr10g0461021 [Helianthus annuus]|nr:hypothetical protein HanRHA438_Chr10g0461021 [Helianthus annuus]